MTITQETSATLFVVVGSTGIQGTSVINAIKEDEKTYRVRAITRDPSKDAAKERAAWGCEVVAADVSDLESAKKAFAGAEFAFAMTLPGYGPGITDPVAKEYSEGKNQIDAAKAAGVRVLVWAGLPSLSKSSGGKYPTAHFDAKAQVTEYARTLESPEFKVIDVQPAGYITNYYSSLAPRKSPAGDGSFVLGRLVPSPKLEPLIDMEHDFGYYVIGAIKSGKLDTVLAAAEYLDEDARNAALMKVSGGKIIKSADIPISAIYEPVKAFRGEVAAKNFVNMILAISEFGYYSGADLGPSNAILSRPARKLEESVVAYKDRFAKVFA